MKQPFKEWLGGEAAARDPDATLVKIEARASRRRSWTWAFTAAAVAAGLLVAISRPHEEVFHLYLAEADQPSQAMELEMHRTQSRLSFRLPHLTALLMSLAMGTAHAEPAPEPKLGTEGISTERVSFEFKAVPAPDVFALLQQVSGTKIMVDPCVTGRKLDLRMTNVPVKIVLDAIGDQLNLAYTFDGQTLKMRCRD